MSGSHGSHKLLVCDVFDDSGELHDATYSYRDSRVSRGRMSVAGWVTLIAERSRVAATQSCIVQ